jgi:hypothetical protein
VKKETPRCSNAEPGTYGHECGKEATHAGKHPFSGNTQIRDLPYFVGGRCPDCLKYGYENKGMNEFAPVVNGTVTFKDGLTFKWGKVNDWGYHSWKTHEG